MNLLQLIFFFFNQYIAMHDFASSLKIHSVKNVHKQLCLGEILSLSKKLMPYTSSWITSCSAVKLWEKNRLGIAEMTVLYIKGVPSIFLHRVEILLHSTQPILTVNSTHLTKAFLFFISLS